MKKLWEIYLHFELDREPAVERIHPVADDAQDRGAGAPFQGAVHASPDRFPRRLIGLFGVQDVSRTHGERVHGECAAEVDWRLGKKKKSVYRELGIEHILHFRIRKVSEKGIPLESFKSPGIDMYTQALASELKLMAWLRSLGISPSRPSSRDRRLIVGKETSPAYVAL